MVEFEVIDKNLNKTIEIALRRCDDLTIPFTLMVQSWFKSNRAIFDLKGPGQYDDINDLYKVRKQKKYGFVYPILKASGKLADSITKPGDPNSIDYIINKNSLILGSRIPYGKHHQYGAPRANLPKRPWILIGSEQTAPKEINKRRELWIKLLSDYVKQSIGVK